VLVWLTPKARELLGRAPQVLSEERLVKALRVMSAVEREHLVLGMRALVCAADSGRSRGDPARTRV
jgi:hypothetical protein